MEKSIFPERFVRHYGLWQGKGKNYLIRMSGLFNRKNIDLLIRLSCCELGIVKEKEQRRDRENGNIDMDWEDCIL